MKKQREQDKEYRFSSLEHLDRLIEMWDEEEKNAPFENEDSFDNEE